MKHSASLRNLLVVDAGTCAALAAILLLAARPLGDLMDIPSALLIWAGFVLVPTAVFMATCAILSVTRAWGAWLVVLGNAGWVVVSLALPISGGISPNILGWTFIVAQSAAVSVLAVLEYRALRPRQIRVGEA